MRGIALMIESANGDNGTTCGLLFFVRGLGRFHIFPSSSLSRIPATSFRRSPVSSNSRNTAANVGWILSQPHQNRVISSLVNTRSRDCPLDGFATLVHGLTVTNRFRCNHPNKELKAVWR